MVSRNPNETKQNILTNTNKTKAQIEQDNV